MRLPSVSTMNRASFRIIRPQASAAFASGTDLAAWSNLLREAETWIYCLAVEWRFGLPLQLKTASLDVTEAETLLGNDGAELPDSLAEQRLNPGRSPADHPGMVAESSGPVRPLHFAVSA